MTDQQLEPDGMPDESLRAGGWEHPVLSAEEAAEGQRLGEEIDTDDDEDSGVEEPDFLLPVEEANPYSNVGEVDQDAIEPA